MNNNSPETLPQHTNLQKTVFVIAGPTAVGKTTLAIDLARRLGTAVLSADSRQCYREMSIGTAKPTPEELQLVQHYFIDAFPVTEHISAASYEQLALGYLTEIFRNHHTAVVCGGTGLYIKALTEGLDPMPETDAAIAKEVNRQYAEKGLTWLRQAVEQEDPAFFKTGETQNPARLMRALIFVRSNGSSILNYRTGERKKRDFNIVKYALTLPREDLYLRIDQRVDQMMAAGLLDEVRRLEPFKQLKNLQTVGYAELFDYLEGKYTLGEAIEKIKQHTRNYAKRQLTWFRKDDGYAWLDAAAPDLPETILSGQK